MVAALQSVRIRDKHQITLPKSIVQAAQIRANDELHIEFKNGAIILTARDSAPKNRKSIMDFAGIAKGMYGKTAAEVDAYIANERAAWER